MYGSVIIEVAIGLIFIFLLVSLISSGIGSKVSDLLAWRSRDLETGIRDYILQGNERLLAKLYDSPLISALAQKNARQPQAGDWVPTKVVKKPVHIPPETFVLAMFDSLVPGAKGATTIDQLISSVAKLPMTSPLRDPLLGLITRGDLTIDKARTNVENWFDAVMGRVSETYKRQMWLLALVIGIVTSVVLNVDTISIASRLWRDSTVRATTADAARQYAAQPVQSSTATDDLNKLNLPIGWDIRFMPDLNFFPRDWLSGPEDFSSPRAVLLKVLGWLITGFAGAQGAPFWFDLLKKVTGRE